MSIKYNFNFSQKNTFPEKSFAKEGNFYTIVLYYFPKYALWELFLSYCEVCIYFSHLRYKLVYFVYIHLHKRYKLVYFVYIYWLKRYKL